MDTNYQNPISQEQRIEPFQILDLMIRFKNAFLQMWVLLIVLGILLGSISWYREKSTFVPLDETKAIFTGDAG